MPAHLFRFEAIDLLAGCDRRLGISIARRFMVGDRLRRQRCGLSARSQRRRARGKSKGEFQKMATFHDISLSRHGGVMQGDFDRGEMNAR